MDEKIRILKMIEEGKITSAEGEKLLAAIDEKSTKIEKEKIDGAPKWLKIRVFEENEKGKKTKANINVPIAIVETGLKIGKGFDENLDSALNGVDFNDIMDMIRSGAEGKIVDIETDEGETVEIYIE
ncbi:MAG: hypothetical protein H0S78_05335 [Tissierellales bacterium]|jgi:DUF4097 and DUF4098 domain-containing protein YvlB|nr:hypothetical protein [Tissierellales bacterium]